MPKDASALSVISLSGRQPSPEIAAFRLVEPQSSLAEDAKWPAYRLPVLHNQRSIAESELKSLRQRREALAEELARKNAALADLDAQIYGCEDIVRRVDAVCHREGEAVPIGE